MTLSIIKHIRQFAASFYSR